MNPSDDILWPKCGLHKESHMCDETREVMINFKDHMEPGLRHSVPIEPSLNIYAEVSINPTSVIKDLSYKIFLVRNGDLPNSDPEMIDLGLWNFGEGRLVVSSVIQGWVKSVVPDRCTSHYHSFKQEMELQNLPPSLEKANDWCLAYHDRCYPCHRQSFTRVPPDAAFNAASFGLGGISSQGNTGITSSQERAREALNNRFGL